MPVWIITVQWISRSVLVLLFVLSIWSVATMLRCSRLLKKADGSVQGRKERTGEDIPVDRNAPVGAVQGMGVARATRSMPALRG